MCGWRDGRRHCLCKHSQWINVGEPAVSASQHSCHTQLRWRRGRASRSLQASGEAGRRFCSNPRAETAGQTGCVLTSHKQVVVARRVMACRRHGAPRRRRPRHVRSSGGLGKSPGCLSAGPAAIWHGINKATFSNADPCSDSLFEDNCKHIGLFVGVVRPGLHVAASRWPRQLSACNVHAAPLRQRGLLTNTLIFSGLGRCRYGR